MHTRSLGRTDIRMSEITLGTWGLAAKSYGEISPERFDETVRAAIDNGITSFDLAPLWGDGEGERRVGKLLEDVEDPIVITRAGARRVDGKVAQNYLTKDLIADCEGSLERLGRETIDVWLLHNPSEEVLRTDDWREAVDKLAEGGKIRAWGASVANAEQARLALTKGAQAICITHNLLSSRELDALKDDLANAGAGVLACSPLAYGMLAGQWSPDRKFADGDHRKNRWNYVAFGERIRQVNLMRFLVGNDHKDLATAAVRFVLGNPSVTSAIVGARTALAVASIAEASKPPPYVGEQDMMKLAKVRASWAG